MRARAAWAASVVTASALVAGGLVLSFRPASPTIVLEAARAPVGTEFGASVSGGTGLAVKTSDFGHLPIIRISYSGLPAADAWTTGPAAINKSAVILSFAASPGAVLAGADDSALSRFFDTAPSGHRIYYAYYSEPEAKVGRRQFTVSQYRRAWTHIAALARKAGNRYLTPTLILSAADLQPRSGVKWKSYLPGHHVVRTVAWDAYPAGTLTGRDPRLTPPDVFMGPAVAAAKRAGLQFGFAGFALATAKGRPMWLKTVGDYLMSSGALFGVLTSPSALPGTELTDQASIQAWRAVVATSGTDQRIPIGRHPLPPGPAPAPTSPAPVPTSPAPSKPAPSNPAPSKPAPSSSGPATPTPAPSKPAPSSSAPATPSSAPSTPASAPTTPAPGAVQSGTAAVCGQPVLNSPYNYDGAAGVYASGTAGLPTYGTAGSDFPKDTAGVVLATGTKDYESYQLSPNTVYYLLPGTHAGSFQADTNDAFVGGLANGTPSILSGSYSAAEPWAIDSNSTLGNQPGVTIEYLTIEKFTPTQNAAAINQDTNTGWTIKDNTVTLNVPGAGIFAGTDNTITNNCLTLNGQYGFQSSLVDSWGADSLTGGPYDITVASNEISYNDTCDYSGLLSNSAAGWNNYDPVPAADRNPNCGTVTPDGDQGGFKLWHTDGVTIKGNYIHDNWGPAAWIDTDNANTTITGNRMIGNEGQAVFEEISYNFSITDNYMADNNWTDGLSNPGFPESAIYVSESGSDTADGSVPACPEASCAGQGAYPTQSVIRGNTLVDNGGNIFLWQNSNRHCSDGSDGACTLTGGSDSPFTLSACAANLPTATVSTTTYVGNQTGSPAADWWDGCQWQTANVSVTGNVIDFNPSNIPDCNSRDWADCGAGGTFSEYGGPNSKEPDWAVPTQLTFFSHDTWSDNTYNGPSTFVAWNQGNGDKISWSDWTGNVASGDRCSSSAEQSSGACTGPFGQDAGSTFSATPVATNPTGTPPSGPAPSSAPSSAPSPSPSPTSSSPAPAPSSPAPVTPISSVPTGNAACNFGVDTWSGDASNVGYSVSEKSATNGDLASFSVVLNANKGTTEVVGYPSDQCLLYKALPSTLTSSFDITPPANSSGLDYEYAYDIWLTTAADATSNNWTGDLELMIWTYVNGQVPAGSVAGTLSDGSKVWVRGSNSTGTVSVVLPKNVTSGTVNIASIISQLKADGYITSADTGDLDVEYGIEAPYGGGQTFNVNGFSVSS